MRAWRILTALIAAVVISFSHANSASAAVKKHRVSHAAPAKKQSRRKVADVQPYRGALVEDADSGKVLYELNADMPWPPASMAKMMLLLVADAQVRAGRFKLDGPGLVSERSAHTRVCR